MNLTSNLGISGGIAGSGTIEIHSMTFNADSVGAAAFGIIFDSTVGSVITQQSGGSYPNVAPNVGGPVFVNLVSVVPLPAGVWMGLMLLGAIAGFGFVRRLGAKAVRLQ